VVVDGTTGVHGPRLEQRTDDPQWLDEIPVGASGDRRGPGLRPVQAQQHPHRGRLTGTVRTQEPVTLTGCTVNDR
jgi:hypothetical protein